MAGSERKEESNSKGKVMIKRQEIDVSAPLTEQENEMLKALEGAYGVPDEENPELTDEELERMAPLDRMAEYRRIRQEFQKKAAYLSEQELQRDDVVLLSLSDRAVQIAESFGENYTAVLSHILEKTLTDPELLKQLTQDEPAGRKSPEDKTLSPG